MRINSLYVWALIVATAAAVVALIVNVQLAFFLAFFAIVGWWAWQWPHQAVYVFIVVAPLLPMFKITQTVGTFTLVKDVLILTLFLKLFIIPLLTKRLPYRRNSVAAPVFALIAWVALSTLQAGSLTLGILRARDIVLYILAYFVVLYLPPNRQFYRQALIWLLMSGMIVATLGWYQFYATPDSAVLRFDPAQSIWIPRVSSVMAHPSVFGQYLILLSTLLTALIMTTPRRLLGVVGLLYILPLIYLTYSRAVWLGYVAGIGIMVLLYGWRQLQFKQRFQIPWKLLSGALVSLVVVMLLLTQFTSVGVFLRSALDPTYASNAARLDFLVRLIAPMNNHQALLGMGLGDVVIQNFRSVDVTAEDIASGASRTVQLAKDLTLVDNQHLKTFVEMGLVGLILYAWLYWRVARASWLVVSDRSGAYSRTIGVWSLGFLATFVVQGFFIDIWDIFPTNAAFWIIVALVSRELTSEVKNPA